MRSKINPLWVRCRKAGELVESGWSIRKASEAAGVSRDTVTRWMRGEIPLWLHKRVRFPWANTRPQRCKTCGGMVYMPCLRCQLEGVA